MVGILMFTLLRGRLRVPDDMLIFRDKMPISPREMPKYLTV
jgi:hypothetical protein